MILKRQFTISKKTITIPEIVPDKNKRYEKQNTCRQFPFMFMGIRLCHKMYHLSLADIAYTVLAEGCRKFIGKFSESRIKGEGPVFLEGCLVLSPRVSLKSSLPRIASTLVTAAVWRFF